MAQFATSFKVGWFLGIRQLRRANRWTTGLIVFIMTLTFLNLVVVSGILVGLIVGGNIANRQQYTGDVIITTLYGKSDIQNTQNMLATISANPHVATYSERFIKGGTIEANYKTRTNFNDLANTSGTQITGVDVDHEEQFSDIRKYVKEGAFLDSHESGFIVIGANLLERYSSFDTGTLLKGVYPGDTVKVTIGNAIQEFVVKGILKSKVGEVSLRAFITKNDFLRLAGRDSLNANEISVKHDTVITDDQLKQSLVASGFSDDAKIQTATEAIPDFLNQIKIAFGVLGNMISAIGIVVASITIFIVIFINAITRRKFIGILKGIGVSPLAIQISYLIQSLFYAFSGSVLGTIIIYGFLVPLVQKHPIDFPFSDGILVADPWGTFIRFIILLVVTLIAGFIPARMIVRQNTLDSILGR
jgi:ABC-type lipoprotein release transport system permease subunit